MQRLAFALLVIASGIARAQNSSALIHGVIRDDQGAPVADALVDVLSLERVRADSAGRYRAASLPPGTLIVRVTMLGFQPAMKMVAVIPGEDLELDVTLLRATRQLPTVVVREDSTRSPLLDPSGFDERRAKSVGGWFITANQIARTRTFDMRTLFHGIPGVEVDTGGIIVVKHGEISLRDLFLTGAAVNQFDMCVGAQVFLDGVAMPQPFDINTVAVDAVRGIEIYDGPATTPAALRTPKTVCGTIAIRTKRH